MANGYIFQYTQTLEGYNIAPVTNTFTSPIYPTKDEASKEGVLYSNSTKNINWNVIYREFSELRIFSGDDTENRLWGGYKGIVGPITKPD